MNGRTLLGASEGLERERQEQGDQTEELGVVVVEVIELVLHFVEVLRALGERDLAVHCRSRKSRGLL